MGNSYGNLNTSRAKLVFPGFDNESSKIENQINIIKVQQNIGIIASALIKVTPIPTPVTPAMLIISSLIKLLTDNEELKEALINSKIEEAVSNSAICEFKAELKAVENRLHRILDKNLTIEDKRLEVVPAIHSLEKMLEMMSDESHIFFKVPLISSPYLTSLAYVFIGFAKFTAKIIPSYRGHFRELIEKLLKTLNNYKYKCIRERLSLIKIETFIGCSAGDPDYEHFKCPIRHQNLLMRTVKGCILIDNLIRCKKKFLCDDYEGKNELSYCCPFTEYITTVKKKYSDEFNSIITLIKITEL
jgi:hypothetical protein